MIEEIILKYGNFADSWIESMYYKLDGLGIKKSIRLKITVSNLQNNCSYETIDLICEDVQNFIFKENTGEQNMSLKDSLILKDDGLIILDFNPIDHFDHLEENPDSCFLIKCKNVKYSFLSFYEPDRADM